MKLNTLTSALLVSTLGFSAAANASIIDLFTLPNPAVTITDTTAGATPVTALDQVDPEAIGGYRDIIVNKNVGVLPGQHSAATVGEGYFSFANGSDTDGTATIQWDGLDNSASLNTIGLDGANLINQTGCPVIGCNAFTATVLIADQGFEYQITVYDMEGDWATLISDTLFPVSSPYDSVYYFDWFNLPATAPSPYDYFIDGLPFDIARGMGAGAGADNIVDFDNIGALEFVINTNGTVAVDLTIDSITKANVPEPGTLALIGLGLLGMGVNARRKSAA
jgi:hypothetical protein